MMGRGFHRMHIKAVMDHLSEHIVLSVLRGEAFKRHDSGLPRPQDVGVHINTDMYIAKYKQNNSRKMMPPLSIINTIYNIAVIFHFASM